MNPKIINGIWEYEGVSEDIASKDGKFFNWDMSKKAY